MFYRIQECELVRCYELDLVDLYAFYQKLSRSLVRKAHSWTQLLLKAGMAAIRLVELQPTAPIVRFERVVLARETRYPGWELHAAVIQLQSQGHQSLDIHQQPDRHCFEEWALRADSIGGRRQLCASSVESTETIYLIARVARVEMLEALYDFYDMLSSCKSLLEVPQKRHMYVYLCQAVWPRKLLERTGFSVHHLAYLMDCL